MGYKCAKGCGKKVDCKDQRCKKCVLKYGTDTKHNEALQAKRIQQNSKNAEKRKAGLCMCGKKAADGYKACSTCREKAATRHRTSATNGTHQAKQASRIASSICTRCSKKAKPGRKMCEDCQTIARDKQVLRRANKICVSCNNSAEEGRNECLPCIYRNNLRGRQRYRSRQDAGKCRCGGERLPERSSCKSCHNKMQEGRDFSRETKTCIICRSTADNGTLYCAECLELKREWHRQPTVIEKRKQKEADGVLRSKKYPDMKMSIFEAFDRKRAYLTKILSSVSLPPREALYMDSEMISKYGGNDAANIHEWTAMTSLNDKPTWFTLRANKDEPLESSDLEGFAKSVTEWITSNKCNQVVMYGSSRPEFHRLRSLEKYLNDGRSLNFDCIEPQAQLLGKIFTRRQESEFDVNDKIYVPEWSLAYISAHLNRCDDKQYCKTWQWPVMSSDCDSDGKSVLDVAQLFNLFEVLRLAQLGKSFGLPSNPVKRKQGESGAPAKVVTSKQSELPVVTKVSGPKPLVVKDGIVSEKTSDIRRISPTRYSIIKSGSLKQSKLALVTTASKQSTLKAKSGIRIVPSATDVVKPKGPSSSKLVQSTIFHSINGTLKSEQTISVNSHSTRGSDGSNTIVAPKKLIVNTVGTSKLMTPRKPVKALVLKQTTLHASKNDGPQKNEVSLS